MRTSMILVAAGLLGACGTSSTQPKANATPDKSYSAKMARAKECLESDSMLALNKEGVFVNAIFATGESFSNNYNVYLTLPDGKHTDLKIGGYGPTDVLPKVQDRVIAALNDVCSDYAGGMIDAKEASRRIGPGFLNVGAGEPKYEPKRPTPQATSTSASFIKKTNG